MRVWLIILGCTGVLLIAVPMWFACYKLNLALFKRQHFLGDDDDDDKEETFQDIDKELMDYGEAVRHEIKFPDFYHVTGVLRLPYDEIAEPFEAWYAGKYNMSRIDYYYGMDKTYQRGDLLRHGLLVKIVPVHWTKGPNLDKNSISCWYRPGFRWSPKKGQHAVPTDLSKFKFSGEEMRSGMPCLVYLRKFMIRTKVNTHRFYVTKNTPYRPVRYEVHGYDSMLHSVYDHYILDYMTFHRWDFDYDIMKIPKGNYCYRAVKKLKSRFFSNPMEEFVHENWDDQETENSYSEYKKEHGKEYADEMEHEKKKHIYRHNMRLIRSHNRANLNFTLSPNELTDLTEEEFELYKGMMNEDTEELARERDEIPQVRLTIPRNENLPKNLDWREYGAVSPVKGQGLCGSCWTFSAVTALEGAHAIQTGRLVEFAAQQLLDCTWGFGNNGCRGGYSWKALKWIRRNGIATSKSYGRYLSQEGYCHCAKKDKCNVKKLKSFRTVKPKNNTALKIALTKYGPGSMAINCDRKTLKFYSAGIYDDPKCKSATDHAVAVVGYGVEQDIPYWIIKNSWGRFWGDHGFIKIAQKNNLCGVVSNGALMATFYKDWKQLDQSPFPFHKLTKGVYNYQRLNTDMKQLYKFPPFDEKRSHIPKHPKG